MLYYFCINFKEAKQNATYSHDWLHLFGAYRRRNPAFFHGHETTWANPLYEHSGHRRAANCKSYRYWRPKRLGSYCKYPCWGSSRVLATTSLLSFEGKSQHPSGAGLIYYFVFLFVLSFNNFYNIFCC